MTKIFIFDADSNFLSRKKTDEYRTSTWLAPTNAMKPEFYSMVFKWAKPGLFLFIFVIFT